MQNASIEIVKTQVLRRANLRHVKTAL